MCSRTRTHRPSKEMSAVFASSSRNYLNVPIIDDNSESNIKLRLWTRTAAQPHTHTHLHTIDCVRLLGICYNINAQYIVDVVVVVGISRFRVRGRMKCEHVMLHTHTHTQHINSHYIHGLMALRLVRKSGQDKKRISH